MRRKARNAREPEDRIDLHEISWTPQGAYVRFRGPQGRRAAYVPEEAIVAARSGTSTRIAAAVPADGGPPLGAWAQALADELAFAGSGGNEQDPQLRSPTPLPHHGAHAVAAMQTAGGGSVALAVVLMGASGLAAMTALGLILAS